MNLRDDYNKIAEMALEEKKMQVLDKWLKERIPTYYIMIDPSLSNCEQLNRWKLADNLAGID